MLGTGWITLRQAEEALQNGRLEEAQRLLHQPEALGQKGSSPLLRQLVEGLVARGQRHLGHDNLAAAWNDLLQAEKIGAGSEGTARLRQELTQRSLVEVRKLLEAGEPTRALAALDQLSRGPVRSAEAQLLEEVARGWGRARDLAGRGDFAQALQALEQITPLLPRPPAPLDRLHLELQERRQAHAALMVQLHEAVAQGRWPQVVGLAEEILALAPQNAEALKARARAWKAIEPASSPRREPRIEVGQRLLLWIDGVGGYLVCLGKRVTIGQAVPESDVDIPLLADLSRQHAVMTRDPEGYLLEALRPLQVNGKAANKTLLRSGDRITLGSACQLEFRQPVPVSTTARLDLVSGHRLPLAVDGVLLMAETLVLGSGAHAHVEIPDLEEPVVLFRSREGLAVRHVGNLVINGKGCHERGELGYEARVTGDAFALAIETVGTRMGTP
jgi:tetratricopeptide (TPR) repeat protein